MAKRTQPDWPLVDWPPEYEPDKANLAISNELVIEAGSAEIWAWLIRPRLWSSYNRLISSVRLATGTDVLVPGVDFRWRQLGLPIESRVRAVQEPYLLSWLATAPGIVAFHAWLLTPAGSGTRVRTVETQRGRAPQLLGPLLGAVLHRAHAGWLAGLDRAAHRPFPS